MSRGRLERSRNNKMIAGVCGGLTEHYGWKARRVRLGFLILALFGAGELLYVVLWVVIPKADDAR